MKKLLILLFSILLLSSPSVFADDISDFEIEGMSIGDNLLDYMTEEEILEEIELNKDDYPYLNEPNKYVEIYFWNVLPTYDNGLSVFVKNNSTNQYITNKNEKYTILSIYGMMNYIEDFDSCLAKKDEIVSELSKMFPNAQKIESDFVHPSDPSGKSIIDRISFHFDSGAEVNTECLDFDETFRIKANQNEGLIVSILSEEIINWFSDY